MLGIARQLARHGMPLVGINQGRLGFITDIAARPLREALAPMIAGDYEEEQPHDARRQRLARRRARSSKASR